MSPVLALTLTPNRSLDRRHAAALVGGVAAVFMLGGIRLLVLGAWPVIPFMGLDVALLYWAFRASYTTGKRFETLHLTAEALTIRRVGHRGDERHIRLDPFSARARLEHVSDLENRLWIESWGQSVPLGSFLSPPERKAIHAVISTKLADLRANPR